MVLSCRLLQVHAVDLSARVTPQPQGPTAANARGFYALAEAAACENALKCSATNAGRMLSWIPLFGQTLYTHLCFNRVHAMAEIAGLVIGAAGVPALFTTCVECLDYVTLERNHGKDLETCIAKVAILNGRLNACGDSFSIMTTSHTSNGSSAQWKQHNEAIAKSLVGIRNCFRNEKDLEKRYGLRAVPANSTICSLTNERPSSLAEIESTFNITSRRRQRETAIGKRVWWAIHDKNKFDTLINDLVFFIESLESIGIQLSVTGRQEQLLKAAIEHVRTSSGIQLLGDAVREMPSRLNTSQATPSTGHTFIRTIISERGRMIMGNVDVTSDSRHYYADTKVRGKAIGGDVSADAMERFFK